MSMATRAALLAVVAWISLPFASARAAESNRPNIVLIMADDQGWGETAYNGHPQLKTPILDEMAAQGLRFDRFYSGGCVCSPTRTSVMTGRNPTRSGVFAPNYSTRPEEITVARVLKGAGYRTGHFGKWHIGAVKKASPVSPGAMGFDEYLSHDNFFEMDPPLSDNGADPKVIEGESSEIVAGAASAFAKKVAAENKPFFITLWFGSPHAPYVCTPGDEALYEKNTPSKDLRKRFAEITAMDRAIGQFRQTLADLKVRENTLVWYCSDNGIPEDEKKGAYNGGWRGKKGDLYEGGVRVPAIIEWPSVVKSPRRTDLPCVTSDIFPTLLSIVSATSPDPKRPIDGVDLKGFISGENWTSRPRPIGFWKYDGASEKDNGRWIDKELAQGTTATVKNPAIDFLNYKHPEAMTSNFPGVATWVTDQYKLVVSGGKAKKAKKAGAAGNVELFDMKVDSKETKNLAAEKPEVVKDMQAQLEEWQRSVERSLSGADYR